PRAPQRELPGGRDDQPVHLRPGLCASPDAAGVLRRLPDPARSDATVTGRDDSVNSVSKDVKVDLHDPAPPTTSLSPSAPTNGCHRPPVTVPSDPSDPSDGPWQGTQYEPGGGPTMPPSAASQLPAGAPLSQAQAAVDTDGPHTVVARAVDQAGRTSQ